MVIKTFGDTANTFRALQNFAVVVQTESPARILTALNNLIASPLFEGKTGWNNALNKLYRTIKTGTPSFAVFAKSGNKKLPFVSFSTLPGVTCPGAGDCINFCYSFSAWRYPSAFARQAQNAYLMRFNRDVIADTLQEYDSKASKAYDLRLYVDGDFSSSTDVDFWFSLIKYTPKARVYGYSKSFDLLASYEGEFPSNYVLNISSGHNADEALLARVRALPITRGDFIAVNIGRKVRSSEHGTAPINKALRQVFTTKAFICPGKCGTCTGKGHACGVPSLKGLPIIIAVH